jgi:multidrug efflux pump subunit AcrA (membrane-fusion protein)
MIRGVLALGIVAAIGAGAYYVFAGSSHTDSVPTYKVEKTNFVRRVHAEGNLRAVKSTPIAAPPGSARGPMKLAWLAPDGVTVKAGDVIVRFDPTDPEKQLRDGQADLDSAKARLGSETIKGRAAVADRDTDAKLAADELDEMRKLQAKDPMIFSRNQIIESEIDAKLGDQKQSHAEQAKKIERSRSQSNTAVISVEQAKAQLAISHANQALARMEIKAPHDGVFVLQRNWRGAMPKLGDSLWPGQSVAEIPILDAMEAEIFVLEVEGSGLAEKQPAEVIIEARPDRVYKGKVRLVDKLAQPRQPGSPVQYFAVVISLDATDRTAMKPGQRVQGTVILDQEEALVVPRQAIVVDKDGNNIVYRKTATGFEPVKVELGAATSGLVVVKTGLAAGDDIALRDPTRSLDAGSGSGSEEHSASPSAPRMGPS